MMSKNLVLLSALVVLQVLAASDSPNLRAGAKGKEVDVVKIAPMSDEDDPDLTPAQVAEVKAAEMGEEKETVMEKQLTELMMSGDSLGATPMGKSVRKIEKVIEEEMIKKVLEAHDKNQKQLYKEVEAIKECANTKSDSSKIAGVSEALYLKTSPTHKLCRAGEAGKYTEKRDIHKEMRDKLKIKELKCKEFKNADNMYATQKANAEVVQKAGSEESESYIRRVTTTFCGQPNTVGRGGAGKKGFLDEYLFAKEGCEKATKAYEKQVLLFKKAAREYTDEKAKCDSLQDKMDTASCKQAVTMKDTCEAYSECHISKTKAHEDTVAMVSMEETDRKAEWRGLKRMQCLIKAFRDGKIKKSEIRACKNKSHTTDHLTIDFPIKPKFELCHIPNKYPATPEYKIAEFAPLPAFAKGKQEFVCTGLIEINTKPDSKAPKGCKCERVTLNGPYSAGALVQCKNCAKIARSQDQNSCPEGTKIFSPRSEMDWKTIEASIEPIWVWNNKEKKGRWGRWFGAWVKEAYVITDISSPGQTKSITGPMNSGSQKYWGTSDGSPWWIRSTPLNPFVASKVPGPNGTVKVQQGKAYSPNCYLGVELSGSKKAVMGTRNKDTDQKGTPAEKNLKFKCSPPQTNYYCQAVEHSYEPKAGSPPACKCTPVVLAGHYSAGALIKCTNCLDVYKSTQKNSCPKGTKIFSPASSGDWKTFLTSAGPLRSPHWIVDVTRPQNGCGGCTKYPMKSSTPAQMTWSTADGSPWWLRSNTYTEPSGDYKANCYMDLWRTPASEQGIMFNDARCGYHSNAYYCQPVKGSNTAVAKVAAPPVEVREKEEKEEEKEEKEEKEPTKEEEEKEDEKEKEEEEEEED